MKKNNVKMVINLHFPDDFYEHLKEVMQDEFKIASSKWGVRLNLDDKENIFKHSLIQLQRKVSDNARSHWDLSSFLEVKINSHKQDDITIDLPSPRVDNLKTLLIYTRDGWEIDQEMGMDAVKISEFYEYIKDKIEFWLRTAVFYGVGSFAE